ncbi:ABC transporter substrate-binding protein [Stackebrandtia nassauensis]|uniref:NMT1/THI5 like domain protein n=1 Tax=Stackebrandtia nassauensis (strain DSM 44728 / CIP 108903 / NRRL B-16338 / NBRC 102104 / LLR-40K-21) TaxID=446470 RepID=D3Q3H6_STANL|nr:ABC transporter substrate-binding protein [Stackebrandtia nassauensis]ADD42017.1 NMT1/THI5 like domain protein [Stackebrandtia nassauensis DSM 44728]
MRNQLAPLAILLALGTTACSPSESADDGGENVTVGVIPIVDVAPIYLGEKQGFFADRDIDLKLEAGQGGAAIVPGVSSGDFQFGFSNLTSLMSAQTEGLKVQAVAPGVASTGKAGDDFGAVVVPKGSSIKSAKDLPGHTVAVNTLNNIGDTTIRESIRVDGGKPDDVEFTEFGFPDMPAQLDDGNVDAAWVVEPFLSIAKESGARPIAWNYVDIADDLTVAAYFTTTEFVDKDPDLVKRFTAAMTESLEYAAKHPDEVRDILSEYADIDAAIAEKITLPAWPSAINEKSTARLAELGVSDGVLKSEPDLKSLLP